MILPKSRHLFFMAAVGCVAIIGFALFLQYVKALEPCPLCISQRIAILALFLVTILAATHNPNHFGYKIYSFVTIAFSVIGMTLAGRQLWIQNLPPDKAPACMPSVTFLVDVLPLADLAKIMLTGSGGCASVQWTFLGLAIPGWTFLIFTAFTFFGFFEFIRNR